MEKQEILMGWGIDFEISPKPLVEIGDHPILWHIMKIYSAAGIDEFIICLGYKGYGIRPYYVKKVDKK